MFGFAGPKNILYMLGPFAFIRAAFRPHPLRQERLMAYIADFFNLRHVLLFGRALLIAMFHGYPNATFIKIAALWTAPAAKTAIWIGEAWRVANCDWDNCDTGVE